MVTQYVIYSKLYITVCGVDAESDDSDWEVELCQCVHCLEVDNAAQGFLTA
jgi:hypothetical protein